ncbi:MAG: (2Fe-2S) ferredoxin domain-containing protein [Anaerobacillus sp.]|uniref:(2Fe-2S) ferredoxin domain-containing protein n=1 Tax=Anaerobacillus sp. TaxID=1872506 RepID=UPI00391BBAF7
MATWNLTETHLHLLICNGSSCNKAGAEQLTQAIRKEIADRSLDCSIHTTRTLCNGRCHDKCVVISYPDGHWYKEMTSEDASPLIERLLMKNCLEEKVSHYFEGSGFVPTVGTLLGKDKDRETVIKVSKKF